MRRSVAVLLATALAAAVPLGAGLAAAVEDVEPTRVGGETRLETAAEIARAAFPDGAEYAVLATSVAFPDALVGSPLAGSGGGPVLLNPREQLASTTREVLEELGVERVTLLGSPASLSEEGVAGPLREAGLQVDRIGGNNLYHTAANVALRAAELRGSLPTIDGSTAVFLAGADDVVFDFPDALAASGPAYAEGFPLLLSESDELSPEAATALESLDPDRVVIFGGVAAVSAEVEADLEGRGYDIERLGGANRMHTATIVGDRFIALDVYDGAAALLARGDAFPDALTSGALAAATRGAIVLAAAPEILSDETAGWLASRCATLQRLFVIGGTAAVSADTAADAEQEAESCESDLPPQTYRLEPQEPRIGEPGVALDFFVDGRFDGEPLAGPLDLGLFPCRAVDLLGAGPDTFSDDDADGGADALGFTNTGNAAIAVVDGEDIQDTRVVRDAAPDADGDIDVRLASGDEDCAVLVVWSDTDDDGDLAVSAEGYAAEPYGIGSAEWSTS